MDKKNCNHNSGGSGNLFVMGALVGGGLVFLLGTKKGRAILRELSDKGMDALENMEDLQKLDGLEDEVVEMSADTGAVASEEASSVGEPKAKSSHLKRFFKGAKKK